MMTAADNETLVRVGRGTPMGEFMRQFWVPACLSTELEAGGAQMRLMLLGEKLIAFRDAAGRVGIMDHLCPHRLASFFFGATRATASAAAITAGSSTLRATASTSRTCRRRTATPAGTKARAYKTIERGGLVFVYMGGRAEPPRIAGDRGHPGDPDNRNIALTQRDCNWMQALEGDIDTSHLGFLHGGCIDPAKMDPNDPATYTILNKAPEINVSEMPFGTCTLRRGGRWRDTTTIASPATSSRSGSPIPATGWSGTCPQTPGSRSTTSTP